MSNNASDYDNLAFEPSMPRCDIEDLKKQLETANFYLNQNAEYIQRLEDENKNLRQLLKGCENELKIMRMLSLTTASAEALNECDNLITRINAAIGESEE